MLDGALALQVLSLLVGGGMALSGSITPEQLTTFVLYVEFVTAASLSVCDQWGAARIQDGFGCSSSVCLCRFIWKDLALSAWAPCILFCW